MSDSTAGSLERYPLPRLLCFLDQKKFTGVLRLDVEPTPREIVVQKGVPVELRPAQPQGLVRLLLERGRLTNEVFGQLMQALSLPGANETNILRELTDINLNEILKARRYLLFSELSRLFQERTAAFSLTAEPEVGPGDASVAVEPMYLVYNGIRNAYDEERLRAEIGAVAQHAIKLKPGKREVLDRFGFGDDETSVLRYLLQGYWVLDDLLAALPGDDLPRLMLIYTLIAADLLEVVDAESVPRLRPKRPESAPEPAPAAMDPSPRDSADRATMPEPEDKRPASAAPEPVQKPPPTATPAAEPPPEPAPAPSEPGPTTSRPTPGPKQQIAQVQTATGQFAKVRLPPLAVRKARLAAQSIREAGDLKPEAIELMDELIERLDAMDGQSPFELLGLTLDTTAVDVRKTYMQLVKRLHPDRLNALGLNALGEAADTLFKRLTEAHQALSDPEQLEEARRIYLDAEEGHDPEAAARVIGAEVNFQKGEVFFRKGDLAQAEEHFQLAVEGNPEEGEHLAMLAWTRLQRLPKNRRKDARGSTRNELFKALELNPRCARAHYYMGMLYLDEKNNDSALEAFRKAARLKRNYIEAMREIRLIEMRRRREGAPKNRSTLMEMFSRKKKK